MKIISFGNMLLLVSVLYFIDILVGKMPKGFILIFDDDDDWFYWEVHICDYNNTVTQLLIMILSNQQRRERQIHMITNSFRQENNCF